MLIVGDKDYFQRDQLDFIFNTVYVRIDASITQNRTIFVEKTPCFD